MLNPVKDIHVLPCNDNQSHTEGKDCPCNPEVENQFNGVSLIIHNYFMYPKINFLIGRTCTQVEATDDCITFTTEDGTLTMRHQQDCCEAVQIKQIDGDINDLVGTPILNAYCETNPVEDLDYGIGQWTFYRLQTAKGPVVISWYGESNGYYSVEVDLIWTPNTQ
jgi:hypothetical protein